MQRSEVIGARTFSLVYSAASRGLRNPRVCAVRQKRKDTACGRNARYLVIAGKMQTEVFQLTVRPGLTRGTDHPYGLRGVSSVWVLIESLSAEEANIGLADDTVRTDVELRLRSAGLRVISPEEAKKIAVKDNTFLYVNVAVTSGGWAATVLAQFAQAAYVLRNSLPIGTAFTWTDVSTLSSPSLGSVRSEIKDLVDKFLNEWLTQNPRP